MLIRSLSCDVFTAQPMETVLNLCRFSLCGVEIDRVQLESAKTTSGSHLWPGGPEGMKVEPIIN
jgi:hypothetical protein